LSDYNLKFCQGCCRCFDKGEEFCPLKDDRDVLLEKIERSDGVIFATPSYAYQVSARMKNFLDRIAFIFHRPRFFGKTFTAIITQGVPAGDNIRKYLEDSGENLGFHVIKGCCIWTLDPMSGDRRKKLEQKVKSCSERFYKDLIRKTTPVPSLFRLMIFRMGRSGIQYADMKCQSDDMKCRPVGMRCQSDDVKYRDAGAKYYDYCYFKEKGWFESNYYYEVSLGPIKKLFGRFFDFLGRQAARHI